MTGTQRAHHKCWQVCGDGGSKNGGVAACAAANRRPLVILPMSRQREQRARREREQRKDRFGEESGTDSEEEDPNGEAAACATARIEEIDAELWQSSTE